MAATIDVAREGHEHAILLRAAETGFSLVQYETDTGQVVWEWRRGDEPRPQFVTRRVALHWMADWLHRDNFLVS
jgi:hypothetical protein